MRKFISPFQWATGLVPMFGILCLPRAAEAQFWGPQDGLYLPTGLTASTVIHRTGKVSGFLGGEMSLAYLDKDEYWYGGYVDGGYDFGTKGARLSLGPEFGYKYFGADAGLLLEEQLSGWGKGFVVRGVATAALVAIYGRYGQIVMGDKDLFCEVGILIKMPGRLK